MTVAYQDATVQILLGDVREELRALPDGYAQTVVTSPPYWGLRDYGVTGQLGMEKSPDEYVEKMVEIFREVRRVLKNDGTLWLNLGDSYANDTKWGGTTGGKHAGGLHGEPIGRGKRQTGLKAKDLVGMPWRVAFALQADGWYLRSDIIWHKPNPMPESVTDRPTKAHEYIFLFSKSARYYYDRKAIEEPVNGTAHARGTGVNPKAAKWPAGWDSGDGSHGSFHREGREGKNSRFHQDRDPSHGSQRKTRPKQNASFSSAVKELVEARNKRSVWTVATQPYTEAHFATFPPKLIEPCILAGAPAGAIVLDPFAGSGTTPILAKQLGRIGCGIELNPEYVAMILKRLSTETEALPL